MKLLKLPSQKWPEAVLPLMLKTLVWGKLNVLTSFGFPKKTLYTKGKINSLSIFRQNSPTLFGG